jgi:hypothetical protein
VSAWADLAVRRSSAAPRILHAVAGEEGVDPWLDSDFGVFDLGEPRRCSPEEMAVQVHLDGEALDRKVAALLRQESQTAGLVNAVGLDRFRAWVATESFAEPAESG